MPLIIPATRSNCHRLQFSVIELNLPCTMHVHLWHTHVSIVADFSASNFQVNFRQGFFCSDFFRMNHYPNYMGRWLDLVFTNDSDKITVFESDIPMVKVDTPHIPLEILCNFIHTTPYHLIDLLSDIILLKAISTS